MNRIRSFIATAVFLATLTLGRAQVFETEPNDTLAQANTIFSGVPISAQSSSFSDIDIFAITLNQAGGLNLSLISSSAAGGFVPGMSFLNSSGTVLASYTGAFRS